MARLQDVYKKTLIPNLMKRFSYSSVMAVPKIQKIVINMGVGEAANDRKIIQNAVNDLTALSGQKPIVTHSKKAISNFKIRENWPIGCKVTLRGERMYEFLDRLINIVIPRVRDFRGYSKRAFDGRGNYNFGLQEQLVFPEIDYDKIDMIRGLNITITTSAHNNDEAYALLSGFSFPFRERDTYTWEGMEKAEITKKPEAKKAEAKKAEVKKTDAPKKKKKEV